MGLGIIFAALVVLILVAGFYLASRPLPPPTPPVGPCRGDSGCPAPQTCVRGICVDVELPGLLKSAQTVARDLHGGLRNLSQALDSALRRAENLKALAAAQGLSCPLAALKQSAATAAAALSKTMSFLSEPGCRPGQGLACGYCAAIAAASAATPPGVLLAVAGGAESAAAEVPAATDTLAPMADALQSVAAAVVSSSEARRTSLSGQTEAALGQVEAAGSFWVNVPAALAAQAAALRKTGYALYAHLLA